MYMLCYMGHEIPCRTTLFLAWFIYFYMGIYVRKNSITQLTKYKYTFVLIGLILSVIEGYIWDHILNMYAFAVSQVKISSCVYAVSVINFIIITNNKYSVEKNILSNIGDNSYGIYYSHMVFVMLCTAVLNKLNIANSCLPMYQLIQLTTSLVLSCLLIKILNSQKF